jgi:DNA polymerase III alpha subunit (gram-positive type)
MPASRRKPTKKTPCKHRARVVGSTGRCRVRKSCAGRPRSLHKVKNTRKNCKESRRYKKKSKPRRKSKSKSKRRSSKKKAKLGKKRKTDTSSQEIQVAGMVFDNAIGAEKAAKAAAVDSQIAADAAATVAAEASAIEDADPVMKIFETELEKIYTAVSSRDNSTYNIKLPVADLTAVNFVANSSDTTNLKDKAEGAAAANLVATGLKYAIDEPLEKWELAQDRFLKAHPMEGEILRKFQTILKSYSSEHIIVLAEGKMQR